MGPAGIAPENKGSINKISKLKMKIYGLLSPDSSHQWFAARGRISSLIMGKEQKSQQNTPLHEYPQHHDDFTSPPHSHDCWSWGRIFSSSGPGQISFSLSSENLPFTTHNPQVNSRALKELKSLLGTTGWRPWMTRDDVIIGGWTVRFHSQSLSFSWNEKVGVLIFETYQISFSSWPYDQFYRRCA